MIDAIHVPCCPQCGSLLEVFRSVKSLPVLTAPSRSLTYGFTPLSMTATVTLAPSVSCQADCTSSMLSTHACWSLTESAGAARGGHSTSRPRAPRPARRPRAQARPRPGASDGSASGRPRAVRRRHRRADLGQHRLGHAAGPWSSSPRRRSCRRRPAPSACCRRSRPRRAPRRCPPGANPLSCRRWLVKPAAGVPLKASASHAGDIPPTRAASDSSASAASACAVDGRTATPTVTT